MKKFILSISILISLVSFSFAQMDNGQGKEKHSWNKWGCSFAINDANSQVAFLGGAALQIDADGNMISGGKKTNHSFSFSVTPKYYLNNLWQLRFEYGITKIDLKNNVSKSTSTGFLASPSYGISSDIIEQKINRFVPGIQFNFFTNKKIESFGGVTLQYIRYGNISRNTYSESHDVATDTLISWGRQIINIPGGFAIGPGVFAGFNVFCYKNISLGAEFSSALLYCNVGGESLQQYSYQNIPYPIATGTTTIEESYEGVRFTKIISSFNISFRF